MRLMILVILGPCLLASATASAQERTRADWLALREAKFAVPEGQQPFELLQAMNTLLASTDPALRDAVAFDAAAQWILRKPSLTADQQRQILAMWSGNLRKEGGGDAVLVRSFSALNLSLLAAREIAEPFLTQAEFDRFLSDVVDYLARERDTRGYDAEKGWFHAAAHTADVLKFLARSARLTPQAGNNLLAAIDAKCGQFGQVFQWAEDERLAQVIVSLARRTDFDLEAFRSWLTTIERRRTSLWAAAPAIDPRKFPEVQNLKMILRAAFVPLAQDADSTPGHKAAAAILTTLKAMR